MKPSKDKSPAPIKETKRDAIVADEAPEAPAAKRESIVDGVFDAVTGWAAHGLTGTKRGLEVSARWLDGRAKVLGALATKLTTPAAPAPAGQETTNA